MPEGGRRGERATDRAMRAIARRSPIMVRFFGWVFERALRSDFHAVRVSVSGAPPAPDTRKLVIYCNHPSWWDAVVCVVLAKHLFPDRLFRAPIDAAMLARYGFMGRIGLFGIERGTRRGAADFLAICRELFKDGRNVLMITAQGRFADCRERPLGLEPGVAHLGQLDSEVTYVPLAIEYCLWQERQAEVLLRFGDTIASEELAPCSAAERRQLLEHALEQTMTLLGEDVIARKDAAFTTLLTGKRGVNPLYDGWRRLLALARGRRFNPEHGAGHSA